MKVFVPYHDRALAGLLPDDRLVPYQTEWREYLAAPRVRQQHQAAGKQRKRPTGNPHADGDRR